MMSRIRRRYYTGAFYIETDGLLVHGLVGFLAGVLNLAIPITILYVFYQYLDYLDGEDTMEVQGDIAEYMFGLIVAMGLKLLAYPYLLQLLQYLPW